MYENNQKFLEFVKKILRKIKPRFSFHYVAYTTLFTLVIFSAIQLVTATTPNPGHPWSELGDGVFVFTNSQTTTPYTYTFPAANSTVLTTNAAVTIAQGGTGLTSVADGSILAANAANVLSEVTWHSAGTKVLTNTSGTITWETASSGMTYPGTGIANSTGSGWDTSYTTNGSGTVLALITSPSFTTPSLGVATATSVDFGTTTLLGSRSLTVDTGGVFNIDLSSASGDDFTVDTNKLVVEGDTGNVGIGQTSPTAILHLKAGTTGASTAPLKFTAGTNMTAAEAGAMEWDGTNLFITQTSGPTRKTIAYTSDLSSGYVPYTGATGAVNLGANTLTTSSGIISPKWYPASDSTTAVQINKADGTSNIFNIDTTNGRVGIGSTSPAQKLQLNYGHMRFDAVPAPSAPSGVLAGLGAGNIPNGTYYYYISYVTSTGETSNGPASSGIVVSDNTVDGKISLTIPVGSATGVTYTARKIYRASASGYWMYYLDTVNDNSTTVYVDNLASGSGSALVPATGSVSDTSAGIVYKGSDRAFYIGKDTSVGLGALNLSNSNTSANVALGYNALASMTTGRYNTAIGYGAMSTTTSSTDGVTAIGYNMLPLITGMRTTGVGLSSGMIATSLLDSILIGYNTANTIQTGDYNIIIGYAAGTSTGTQTSVTNNLIIGNYAGAAVASNMTNNLFLGNYSGKYETGSNKLIIDSLDRTTEALGRTSSLIYGVTHATPGNQILSLGGGGNVGIGTISPLYKLDTIGTGRFSENGLVSAGDVTGTVYIGGYDSSVTNDGRYSTAIKTINTASSPSYLQPRMGLFTQNTNTYLPADLIERISILANNGEVGINDTTPDGTLDIDSSITTGVNFGITNTGVYTGTGLLSVVANSATTGVVGLMTANGLSSGSILSLTSAGTAGLTNQKGLNIALSGTNATSAQTTYGAYISNTHAGTTSTNVGLYATASGGTTANYAAIFNAGNVGIGTTSPGAKLEVFSNGLTRGLYVQSSSGGNPTDVSIIEAGGTNEFTNENNNLFGVKSIPISSGNIFYPAANNYAFYGNPSGGVIDWGIYLTGEDKNYFSGKLGIGQNSPTAILHLRAGTASASTAPLKFTAGTNMTAAEAGAMEWDGTNLFITQTTGPTRKTIAYTTDIPAASPITIINSTNLFSDTLGAGTGVTATDGSNFFGSDAGNGATGASYSNFFGSRAGRSATDAYYSNFFGNQAGDGASSASYSNFFGNSAGLDASSASNSNFFGNSAGDTAIYASYSNFFGSSAGYDATNATYSNFIGYSAGDSAVDASYSNLIGYKTGKWYTGNQIGSNNIIIGTNISLPNATANAVNIGGIIFATGTNATTGGNPVITAISGGKVGIGVVSPNNTLQVAGLINFNDTDYNTLIGKSAGANIVSGAQNNTFLGYEAGKSAAAGGTNAANRNTAIGYQPLFSNTTGSDNTTIGAYSLYTNTTGSSNTSIGLNSLTSNTTGSNNTSMGYQSLLSNTTGGNNIAIGYNSLYSNKTNSRSTAIGYGAMYYADNRTPTGRSTYNTALGYEALRGSTTAGNNTGQYNTAIGDSALWSVTSGSNNTAIGYQSLYNNTTGGYNTATGYQSLYTNTTGYDNTANGYGSLYSNTTGFFNTALGNNSLYSNKTNSRSTAIGYNAMYYADNRTPTGRSTYNTALGYEALRGSTTAANNIGQYNTAIGDSALYSVTSASNSTALGSSALYYTTTGGKNSALGNSSMYWNTTGANNTASGYNSLLNNTTGSSNIAIGYQSLVSNKTNSRSTAIGYQAMYYADDRTPTGRDTYNTALGYEALKGSTTAANNTGQYNTAIGDSALAGTTSGYANTAIGYISLLSNTTGYQNTVIGYNSLSSNTTGYNNIAIGYSSYVSNTTGYNNIAIGMNSLYSNKTNSRSTAIGYNAMYYADDRTPTGRDTYNTALGYEALRGSTTAANNIGQYNTAIGDSALRGITSGNYNTAIGYSSLTSNTTGQYNTAIGFSSLTTNSTGGYNTAVGYQSLWDNTTGNYNTAIGYNSLQKNKTNNRSTAVGMNAMYYADDRTPTGRDTYNTALGYEALRGSTTAANNTGRYNTAIGDSALWSNTSGYNNSAVGVNALYNNTTGYYNSALGYNAGMYITNGSSANATSNNSLYLGYDTRASADGNTNEIVIGASTIGHGSNTATWGNTSITNHYFTGNINVTGHIFPTADDTYDLGDNTHRFRDLYLGPQTLHLGTSTSDEGYISYTTSTNLFNMQSTGNLALQPTSGNVGLGLTEPTALFHLKAGTATAGTAPLKLTAGTNLSTTEAGAIEYDGSHLYFTATDAGTRYQLDQQEANWATVGDPTGDGSIDFGSTLQTMEWSTATTNSSSLLLLNAPLLQNGDLLTIQGDNITTGQLLTLNSTSSGSKILNTKAPPAMAAAMAINLSGTAPVEPASYTGLTISSSYVGSTSSTNIGLYVSATGGATANYAAIFERGNVGIGATYPSTVLEIGSRDLGDGVAGPVITLGRNTNGTNTGAGSINFLSKGGTEGYVWQDNAGNMRINTSSPSNANDTSGTVIGAQTSGRNTKQDINDYRDYDSALAMIVNAPLHTFRYIKEVDGYGEDSPLAKERIGFIADEVDEMFMWGNSIDQVSVNGLLIASIKAMDLKIMNINDFEIENTWRDSLTAWFANAENRITRIFTGEICLTEPGQETVCINRTELQSLKALLIESGGSNDGGEIVSPPAETCSDGILNQDETEVDTGGVCASDSTIITPPDVVVIPPDGTDTTPPPDEVDTTSPEPTSTPEPAGN